MKNIQSSDCESPGTRWDEELIGLLQYVFITMRKYDIGKTARELNMSYQDLYAYISGKRTMPITLLKKITEMTGDKIFLDTIFVGSNIVWDFRKTTLCHTDDPVKELLDVVAAVGRINETMRKAIGDGRINASEKTELLDRINYAVGELRALQEAVSKKTTVTAMAR